MVQIIDHIDKIARAKNRDVVYLAFQKYSMDFSRDWAAPDHPRQAIITWLRNYDIAYVECAHFADEGGFMTYQGQIYVDVPYDVADEKYQILASYIEDENGNVKQEFGETKFYYVTLEQAMKNAHHDEPGFWAKWAETF